MFVDRSEELELLRKHHGMVADRSQLVVIYGRRRIGKTALARRFIQEKGGVYIFIEPKSEELILKDAEDIFADILGYRPRIEDWSVLFSLARSKHLAVILDEFQNLGQANNAIYAKVQKVWDEMAAEPGLMVIVIGSYIGMIKRIFRDARQPLFGRATCLLKLRAFDVSTSVRMLIDRGKDLEDAIATYCIFGGIPRYLLESNPGPDDLSRLLMGPSALFREEGINIMALEFGSLHRGYFSTLESISMGKRTPKEISDHSGLPIATVSKYLGELIAEYELVKGELPVTIDSNRLVRYRIMDNFFDYWFRYVHSRSSLIEIDPERAMDLAKSELPMVISRRMEDVIRHLLLSEKDLISPTEIGRWWNRIGEEIDIVAIDPDISEMLFCEIKWRRSRTGCDVVMELKRKSELVQWRKGARKEIFLIVSRSGFTKACLDLMEKEHIHHWDLAEVKRRLLCP